MAYDPPERGEPDWDAPLNETLAFLYAASTNEGVAAKVEAAGPTRDAVTAVAADGVAVGLADTVRRVTRTEHAPALGLFFPEAEGAAGDGVTNDAAALNAALTAATGVGSVVLAPGVSYGFASTLTVPDGTALVLPEGSRLVALSFLNTAVSLGARSRLCGAGTVDGNGHAHTRLVGVRADATDTSVEGLRLTSAQSLLEPLGASSRLAVRDCRCDDFTNGIKLAEVATDIRIEDNWLSDWDNRAIWCLSSAGKAVAGLWIVSNRIDPARTTGGVRQPIAIQGVDTDLHTDFHIIGNNVYGYGTGHADPTNPGSADLISLHRVDGFEIRGNVVKDSGDVGITVSQQCINGTVTGNVVKKSDSCGIIIGSGSSTATTSVSVTGNTCVNNYQNRMADGVTRAAAGVMLNRAVNCTVSGNECDDNQPSNTQLYAVSIVDTTDCTIGTNGHDYTHGHYAEGTNTRTRWAIPPQRIAKVADETVNNTSTLHNDVDFAFPMSLQAVYEFQGYVAYNSSTTADLSLKLSLPTGATAFWVADGPGSTTTGTANTSVSRVRLTEASSGTVGGTGGNAICLISGTITMSTTPGNFRLQWAQATAEATDTKVLAGSWLKLTRVA